MLTKFESRSSRAKAVAFHPTRPWVLVALYSSTIQLWDYRMGAIIDRFEGHKGPVRGLDVHPTQNMFVSCGDDQLLRVWSLSERRLLFTLEGHQDYVRTAFFHKELPWIVSASDDQTVRIWDWQSRKEIATLTGHNHWVSCAIFHPTEDLIISTSLDTTVRAWDISVLRRRYAAPGFLADVDNIARLGGASVPGMPGSVPPGMSNFGPTSIFGDDMFNTELTTKFILEGHDRGVTWVACHETQPFILTASDDKTLKLWRFSGSVAWEVDTLRGHRDEVTACAFHPFADVVVSCSTDETIRTWDLNTRSLIKTFQRERVKAESADRYWALRFHPKINLAAAALDTGAEVFKFERERPAYVASPELLFIGRDSVLKNAKNETVVDLSKNDDFKSLEPLDLSFNSAENTALLTLTAGNTKDERNSYALIPLAKTRSSTAPTVTRSSCLQALFISRNRFCVLVNPTELEIRDMENKLTKSLTLPVETKKIAPAMQGHVLLLASNSVVLFDIQQRLVVAKLQVKNVKYAHWSPSGAHVALVQKHDITIASKKLEKVAQVFETIRIKSVCWDAVLPVLVYSTFSHLKYALMNGDNGILRTLDETLYIVGSHSRNVTALTRGSQALKLDIDPTEYRFKLALVSSNFAEVSKLIQNSSLVGQSIISYLQKRGYPEIALEFVQDPQTRLDLAVESGNLKVASEVAAQLQGPAYDEILATAALEQGNHDILEDVFLRQRDFDKLAFIYLVTGNRSRLQKLEQLAMQRDDASLRFQTSLFLKSAETRVQLLKDARLAPLAYALAKSNGLTDEAEQLLEESEVNADDVHITTFDKTPTAAIAHETWKENWPVKTPTTVNILDLASLSINDSTATAEISESLPADAEDLVLSGDEDLGDEWDLEEQLEEDDLEIDESAVSSVTDEWVRISSLPADHIAAGSFETAFQLLSRQIGVCKFDVLKERFMDVYQANKMAVSGHESLPSVPVYITRGPDNVLPYIPGFDQLQDRLNEAFAQVKSNQLELAVDSFRSILQTTATIAVENEQDDAQVHKVIETCKNYIIAFSIELKRRSLPSDDVKRNIELAAYFTKPRLRNAHAILALRTAIVQASNAKNYSLASHFASEYLKLDSSSATAEKMRKNKSRWDSAKTMDAVDINFDTVAEFDIDPISLSPIYGNQPSVVEPLTGAKYHASNNGEVCAITGFTQVGASASGLRLRA